MQRLNSSTTFTPFRSPPSARQGAVLYASLEQKPVTLTTAKIKSLKTAILELLHQLDADSRPLSKNIRDSIGSQQLNALDQAQLIFSLMPQAPSGNLGRRIQVIRGILLKNPQYTKKQAIEGMTPSLQKRLGELNYTGYTKIFPLEPHFIFKSRMFNERLMQAPNPENLPILVKLAHFFDHMNKKEKLFWEFKFNLLKSPYEYDIMPSRDSQMLNMMGSLPNYFEKLEAEWSPWLARHSEENAEPNASAKLKSLDTQG